MFEEIMELLALIFCLMFVLLLIFGFPLLFGIFVLKLIGFCVSLSPAGIIIALLILILLFKN